MDNAGEGRVGVSEPADYFVPAPRVAPPAATSPPARTSVEPRPRRRPGRVRRVLRSRAFIVAVAVFVLAVVAAGVWAVQRVRAVEAMVADAQSHSAAFQAAVADSDDATARSELRALQAATSRARALTSGTAWGLAGHAPFAGESLSAARDLLVIADEASHRVLPSLESAVQRLGSGTLDNGGSGVNLADLAAARDDVGRAQAALGPLRARLTAVPANGLIGPIGAARTTLAADLDEAASRLSAAGSNLSIALPMLGGDGPRNYLIMLQDPAIPAGPGGGVVAFALVSADAGQFSLVRVGGPGDLPAGMRAVESSPDFPDVARRWASAWRDPVDGVLTLDTLVLSDLLALAGPATLADGTTMYSAERIQLSPAAAARLHTPAGRSAYAADLAHAALDKVLGAGAGHAVTDAVRSDIDAGRIQLASLHSAEQNVLAATQLGGAVPRTDQPFALLSVSQDGGAALGRWLHRSVSYAAGPCSAGRRQATITARLTNSAPAHPQLDWFAAGATTGDGDFTERLRAGTVLTRGARVTGMTLNGRPVTPNVTEAAGHPFASTHLDIPRETGVTLRLTVDEPATGGPALVPAQPLVAAQDSRVDVPACAAGRPHRPQPV